MARNKYPEQTLEQIMAVSAKLFMEKGYAKTSVQDIINEVGMSKGAIYHHFTSKEEILEAVMNQRSDRTADMFQTLIQSTQAANAREKLISLLEALAVDHDAHSLDALLCSQIHNPQFVVNGIKDCVLQDATQLASIMKQGMEDGSIRTEYPDECAEVFLLLLNVWMNPVLFMRDIEGTVRRLQFLQLMMKQLGVDVVSDSLIQKGMEQYKNMGAFLNVE